MALGRWVTRLVCATHVGKSKSCREKRSRSWRTTGSATGCGGRGSHDGEMAAAGEAGWWRKLIPFKRQMRPEEEGEREEANEAKEEAAGEGAGQASEEFDASAPCKVRAESESGRVATGSGGLPWQAAAPGEEAEVAGDGDAQRLAGGKADLRWLRRHVYDDEGEQVRAVEGHFHSRKGVGSRVCVCVFLSLRLPKCVCVCVCVYIYI